MACFMDDGEDNPEGEKKDYGQSFGRAIVKDLGGKESAEYAAEHKEDDPVTLGPGSLRVQLLVFWEKHSDGLVVTSEGHDQTKDVPEQKRHSGK